MNPSRRLPLSDVTSFIVLVVSALDFGVFLVPVIESSPRLTAIFQRSLISLDFLSIITQSVY